MHKNPLPRPKPCIYGKKRNFNSFQNNKIICITYNEALKPYPDIGNLSLWRLVLSLTLSLHIRLNFSAPSLPLSLSLWDAIFLV